MKVIITGASGMVGKGVLLECLDHEEITEVLSIGRSSLELDHPKLKELNHADFSEFESVKSSLDGYDACYLCMGVSVAGLSDEQYTQITHGYTMALANVLFSLNSNMTCIYVSGEGTDSSEKGRSFWARVKGKTENDLLKIGFRRTFLFRPGAIIPLRGIKSRTRMYQFVYDYFMWFVKLIKFLSPNSVLNTTQIGLAMIKATKNSYEKNILRPADIIQVSSWKD